MNYVLSIISYFISKNDPNLTQSIMLARTIISYFISKIEIKPQHDKDVFEMMDDFTI